MTCPDARDQLSEMAFGGLAPEAHKALEEHLAVCACCRRELRELRHVRGLLAGAAAPGVRVDVAAVYREAASRQARRARRWRWVAAGACAAAATVTVAVLGSRLEVRAEAHQVVVRWGAVPPPEAPPAPAPPVVHAPPAPAPQPPAVSEGQFRVLSELVQALAAEQRDSELRGRAEVDRLRALLVQLGEREAQRWSAAERDIDAMYAAQFGRRKGD